MEHRLKRQRDFDLVFKKGKRAFTGAVAMYYVDNVKSAVKIGISVSKKHGSAVQRNRIKRLLRAAYIPLIPQITKNERFCKASIAYSLHVGVYMQFEPSPRDMFFL